MLCKGRPGPLSPPALVQVAVVRASVWNTGQRPGRTVGMGSLCPVLPRALPRSMDVVVCGVHTHTHTHTHREEAG